ncbi:MAG: DMT family transporter [Acidobacteria bacterium]|nr:DMT family transporter [Acidobacteriota bacterium]
MLLSPTPSPAPQPIGLRSALLAVAVSILWGGNVVSIRAGVDSVPPLWSAFWRMLVGVLFVSAWTLHRRVPLRPAPGELTPLLWLGALFTMQIALLNKASEMTSPAYGVVILNAYAIFANLTGHFAGRYFPAVSETRLSLVRALGLALALAGIAMLAFGRPDRALAPRPLLGNALMVISSFLLGVRQVYTRWLVQRVHPARSVVWQMLLSVPLFLVVAAVSEPPVVAARGLTWQAVAAILNQGVIVAGICFIVWAELLRHHSAGTLSMFSFLVPICGIALSSWIFGESLPAGLFFGTLLVLAGVAMVIRE